MTDTADLREQIARIIDPPPFEYPGLIGHWNERQAEALAKADAILAVLHSAPLSEPVDIGVFGNLAQLLQEREYYRLTKWGRTVLADTLAELERLALLPTPTVGEGWQELAELSAKAFNGPWETSQGPGDVSTLLIAADGRIIGTVYGDDLAAFIVACVNYLRSALSASPQGGG